MERFRRVVNDLPRVESRNEDGSFRVVPFTGPAVSEPIWPNGERLAQTIEEMKEAHEAELKRLREEVSPALPRGT